MPRALRLKKLNGYLASAHFVCNDMGDRLASSMNLSPDFLPQRSLGCIVFPILCASFSPNYPIKAATTFYMLKPCLTHSPHCAPVIPMRRDFFKRNSPSVAPVPHRGSKATAPTSAAPKHLLFTCSHGQRPCACILASFNKNTMFCTICKTRSWHPSGKHQRFAAFNLASFKTNPYPCGFAPSQKLKKLSFFSRTRHNSALPIAAAQRPAPHQRSANENKTHKSLSYPALQTCNILFF